MNRLYYGLCALVLLTFSCTGNKTRTSELAVPADTVDTSATAKTEIDTLEQLITETPMPRAADELFDDFLFNFAANKRLQKERVAFPLPVTRNGKTEYVEKGQWKIDHFFMRQGYYTVLFDDEQQMEVVKDTSVNRAVVEKIYFNTGAVQQYMFSRVKGAWMLLTVKTEPISANRNASFLTFYHNFVTDSVFQTESLGETVTFVGPDPDDDFARMEGILTPDTWPAFAPELPKRMIYNIIYGEPKDDTKKKILLMRGISNGQEIEMTFKQHKGQWKLTKLTT